MFDSPLSDSRFISPDTRSHTRLWYRSRVSISIAMLVVVLLFFVIREHWEHWEHLAGRWIYLLLLLCPLMHLFGHGEHGRHGNSGGSND